MHSSQKVVVLLTALLLATPAWSGAKNHYECVLEKMPGAKSNAEAAATWKACLAKHGSPADVKQGSGRGWFGFDSGDDCIHDRTRDTGSETAVTMIGSACRRLYDDPRGPRKADDRERGAHHLGDLLQ